MAWITHEFRCKECGEEFEVFYKREERDAVVCRVCGAADLQFLLSAPNIATFSIMSPEQKRDHLKQRSAKHTQRELDKEPERWGVDGIVRRTKKIQG